MLGLITIILFFLLGCLGAAPVIVAKKPDAKELIDKLVPIQGILGIAGLVLGVLGIITALRYFSLVGIIGSATMAVLGFLMGFGLISKWMAGSPEAAEKAAQLRATLGKFQVPLGFLAIGLSIWWLITWIRYSV